MTESKENGEASNGTSDSDAEMYKEIVEDMDEVEEKEKTSEEKKREEVEANDQTTNADMQSKQHVGTRNVNKKSHTIIHPKDANNEVNTVDDSGNGDELDEEDPEDQNNYDDDLEEEKPKDSDHASLEKCSKTHGPDKYVDLDAEVNVKICERNEQCSEGPHGNDYVKCEKGAENSCALENGAQRDAVLCRSPAGGGENLTREVKLKDNTTEGKMFTDNMENVKDLSMAMESTVRNETFLVDDASEGCESGTEEEQSAFMGELEKFYREKSLDLKVPKFYGVPVNLLKLWRAVIKLGGYDKVTTCKFWRQVGESFNPPKTCTTVSWTFRIFYEKALLDYERHKITVGELDIPHTVAEPVSMGSPAINGQASGSGRARRDAAARAMQGWHSQRFHGNGEVSDPFIKDKVSIPLKIREKHLKNIGGQKRKKPLVEPVVKASRSKSIKGPSDTAVTDVGPAADWVKINVRTTKDCYEVYALVPGLLREEVRVQSDPAGRLVISGEPEHPDNPWGVTPFKKVVSLPSRIDPHQTSAVVTLHGQLFVRVPFEQSD